MVQLLKRGALHEARVSASEMFIFAIVASSTPPCQSSSTFRSAKMGLRLKLADCETVNPGELGILWVGDAGIRSVDVLGAIVLDTAPANAGVHVWATTDGPVSTAGYPPPCSRDRDRARPIAFFSLSDTRSYTASDDTDLCPVTDMICFWLNYR